MVVGRDEDPVAVDEQAGTVVGRRQERTARVWTLGFHFWLKHLFDCRTSRTLGARIAAEIVNTIKARFFE